MALGSTRNLLEDDIEGQGEVRPLTSRVAKRWALSSWLLSALSVGALASIAYSRLGSTNVVTVQWDKL